MNRFRAEDGPGFYRGSKASGDACASNAETETPRWRPRNILPDLPRMPFRVSHYIQRNTSSQTERDCEGALASWSIRQEVYRKA